MASEENLNSWKMKKPEDVAHSKEFNLMNNIIE